MTENLFGGAVPLGLGMALAQNLEALERFSAMTESERKLIIERTHSVESPQEMRAYVQKIAEGEIF
ncbi:MAG: hypothetical protein ACI3VB_09885 [Oscillospiraceae bacterium]